MNNHHRQVQLMHLLDGMTRSQAISTAVKLDIADRLGDGIKSLSQLAQETHMHEPSLHRLLRALASLGIFAEQDPSVFSNTELSSLLRSDHPDSLRDLARFQGSDIFWKSWGVLDYSIKTGKQAFDQVFGETLWSYLCSHPEEEEQFQRAITSITHYEQVSLAQVYDFSGKVVADIGGGYGRSLSSILTSSPQAHGILFDIPTVIEQAQEQFSPHLQERVLFLAGNFFEQVPIGADVYLLKNILHAWPDEECLIILQNCRRAMRPDGKILVIEQIMPQTPDPEQAETFFVDLITLALFGGRQRSACQMDHLYAQSGLRPTRLVATGAAGISLVECVAVDTLSQRR